ncbi:ProQ/FinO family protein [Billgrantia diversa]|nr:ProQ/FinO family protein [Halomonas sp. MCCC 1A13316]
MGQRPREESAQQGIEREASGSAEREQVPPPVEPPQDTAPSAPMAASRQEAPAPALAVAEPSHQPVARQEQEQGEEAAETHDERQGRLAIEQAPSADALLKQWYQRYPNTFFKGHTRPLKVGIHQDLAAREPWPEKLVRRALAGYVNLPRYLKAVREGAERIDLDGAPAGNVDGQADEHAKRKLERLQSERRERGRAAGTTPRREGAKARSASRSTGDEPPRKRAERSARPAAAGSMPAPAEASHVQADPEARMEAKLSALLAKHNGQAKGH